MIQDPAPIAQNRTLEIVEEELNKISLGKTDEDKASCMEYLGLCFERAKLQMDVEKMKSVQLRIQKLKLRSHKKQHSIYKRLCDSSKLEYTGNTNKSESGIMTTLNLLLDKHVGGQISFIVLTEYKPSEIKY